jgi:type VI secretion system protein ImpG
MPMADDDLLHDFLDEMSALRAFVASRPGAVSVELGDPDVIRLVEALAFFTVSTRRAAAKNLDTAWRRLLAQDFGYLLSPLPASGLVRAIGASALFPAARTLPRGAPVQLATRSSRGMFSTTRALPDLRNVVAGVSPVGRSKLQIAFAPVVPRRDAPGTISLFVSPRDSYPVSLDLLEQIRINARDVRAVYAGPAGASVELPCRLDIGGFGADESVHPLARLRSFFHDPRQDLFLHLTPSPPPGVWSSLTVVIDFVPSFDVTRVGADALRSHVVPLVNQRRAFARPIQFAAMRSAEPVLPLEAVPGTAVLSILGVYQTRGNDLVPIRAGALGLGARSTGAGGGWEPERGDDGRTYVTLRHPESFAAPGTLAVEALWYQPGWADDVSGRALEASLSDRHLDGITWEVVGGLVKDDASAQRRPTAELFDLLGLRVRPVLGLDELLILLDWLVPPASAYRGQIARIVGLDSKVAMDLGPRGTGIVRHYTLTFTPGRREEASLGAVFLAKIRELLAAWSVDAWVTFTAVAEGVPMALPAA